MSPKPIRKAVFPVAGLGTRFLPATKAIPKELLPIVDRPLIQYAVDEAREAGIEQMIFVTGRGKSAIIEHFDMAYELEMTLSKRAKASPCLTLPVRHPAMSLPYASKCRWGSVMPSGAPGRLWGMNPLQFSCPMN